MIRIKKSNNTKKGYVKKLKSEYYKHYLEATQLENKIIHLEKNNFNIDNLRENHSKDFIARNVMYLLKKLTRLYYVLMMIKEGNQ